MHILDTTRNSSTWFRRWWSTCGFLLILTTGAHAQDPFIDAVASFTPGSNAGFGAASLPGIVQGPPRGGGELQGSLDVVSLGNDGVIVVRFDLPVICDGPGPDFTVFENAFHAGAIENPVFSELGIVAVSRDGITFIELPYDPVSHAGLAGQTPVLSNPDNSIDPLDPSVSGGDAFDLASIGIAWVAYVRITDPGAAIPDPGNAFFGNSAGFDLDAIAALNACDPMLPPSATPTPTPTPTNPSGQPTSTPTLAGPAPTHDAALVEHRPVRLRIRRGAATAVKRMRVKVRNGDTTGSIPIRLTVMGCGAAIADTPDFDRGTPGAQNVAVVRAGRAKTATVVLTVAAAMVSTPDRRQPATCALALSATADVPGNADPVPTDNTADVELRVLDVNDLP